MKSALSLLIFLLTYAVAMSQTCDYTLEMNDSYGDGWNGAYINVYINGTPAAGNPYSCAVSQTIATITIPDGATVYLDYFPGSWESEVTYTFYDPNGSPLFSDGPNPSTTNAVYGPTVLNCPAPPDTPCDAMSITVGCSGGKEDGDNTGLTNSGITAPSCGTYSGGDCWFSLVVPASGQVKIETYEGTLNDVAMAVYSVTGGCSGTFTEIACDDNSGFGNMAELTLTGQTPGNTLYVRVWDNNNNQTGTFEIDASDLTSNYCVTGNGIDQGSGCAQLTAAANGQLGSIWDADDRLDFTSDWTYDFTVNLGSSDAGADGICFVIQNDPAGLQATGNAGGSMGAGGISNSLIIEIDTYLNTEDRNDGITGVLCSGGPDPDHLDIWLNGDVNPGGSAGCPGIGGTRYIPNAVNLLNGASNYNIENGLDHILRVSYTSATQTLTAQVMNLATTVTYGTVSYSPLNPMTLFGTNAPYFGFTGSTGGLNNQQSACLAATLVLPIELLSFDADCDGSDVNLSWATASELNNDYFTIERSEDGINFEPVAFVPGAGNSNSTLNYSWTDSNPLQSTSYYRLKQTDYNGDFSYSKLKAVNNCNSVGQVNLYPNPSKGQFTFEYQSATSNNVVVEVRSYTGQLVYTATVFSKGEDKIKESVDLSQLNAGMYFVSFINGENKVIKKLSLLD